MKIRYFKVDGKAERRKTLLEWMRNNLEKKDKLLYKDIQKKFLDVFLKHLYVTEEVSSSKHFFFNFLENSAADIKKVENVLLFQL